MNNVENIKNAKQAISLFYQMRHDLPDTCAMNEWLDTLKEYIQEAKESRTGKKVLDYLDEETILSLAHEANDVCEDFGYPEVFILNEN